MAVVLTVGGAVSVKAQDYNDAIGAALGTVMGVSYKHKLAQSIMLESTLGGSFRPKGVYFDVLADYYWNIPAIHQNFSIYAGGGMNMGGWGNHFNHNGTYDNSRFTMGVTLNAGVDFKIPNTPLDLSFDWRPAIQFVGWENVWRGNTVAFGVRYCFR